MGRELSSYEKQKALQAIIPEKIFYGSYNELTGFSGFDLGRGMLNHNKYGLLEALQGIEASEGNESDAIESRILPSSVDHIILSLSLKAHLLSIENKNSGDLALLVPPFSYAFPLFLSYHLIFQHLGECLYPKLGAKFEESQGILIITDNIEMLAHIWRTSAAGAHLRDYINTYTVEAGSFRRFNFNKQQIKKKKEKENNDGSLPWIGIFRAVRHSLPEKLEKKPGVIIVDLLPFRHRKRAEALIEWAKRNAKHVIVVGPLHDVNTNLDILAKIDNVLPIDHFNLWKLKENFQIKENDTFNPVTAFWNLHASIPFINEPASEFAIYRLSGINVLEKLIATGNLLISNSRAKNGTKPQAIVRLSNILLKLCSLPIPLEWYERSRNADGKPTIEELVSRAKKIPPEGYEEKIIIDNLLPQLSQCINEIYTLLKQQKESPKSEALFKLIKLSPEKEGKITIVVDDKTVGNELKTWLKYRGVSGEQLRNLKVTAQEEWAKNQLKEIYLDQNELPPKIILTNPWKSKYLSSFFFSNNTEIFCIALPSEVSIYKSQINKLYGESTLYKEKMAEVFYRFFKIAKLDNASNLSSVQITDYVIKCSPLQSQDYQETDTARIDPLFEDSILLQMMSDNDNDDDEMIENEIVNAGEYFYNTIDAPEYYCKAIKVFTRDMRDPEQLSYYFCSIEEGLGLKIKKARGEQVDDVHPLELQRGDIWVKLKVNQKKELFDTVLSLASNTLTMKWIQISTEEWKEMIKLLWYKYHDENQYMSETYEKILRAVREKGSSISSKGAVASWIKGNVTLVRDEKTVKAVSLAIGEKHYVDRWKLIYKAMRQLWTIHIQLGRALGKVIMEQAARISSYNQPRTRWLDLGSEIRIPLEDVLDVLELKEILEVEKEIEYVVPQSIINRKIDEGSINNLMQKGMIKVVQ
ncbi:DrmE family protein [Brevibacillus sp. SYSU BS000544]|uniref:DrmE family protein n=1 Tax=Brevibacillus sp. SYSU BS000544 TaxID=3416443 RepID=UPI003CE53ADA